MNWVVTDNSNETVKLLVEENIKLRGEVKRLKAELDGMRAGTCAPCTAICKVGK